MASALRACKHAEACSHPCLVVDVATPTRCLTLQTRSLIKASESDLRSAVQPWELAQEKTRAAEREAASANLAADKANKALRAAQAAERTVQDAGAKHEAVSSQASWDTSTGIACLWTAVERAVTVRAQLGSARKKSVRSESSDERLQQHCSAL